MQIHWLDRIGLRRGRFRFIFLTLLAYCVGGALASGLADALGVLLLVATVIDLEKDETVIVRRAIWTIVALSVLARITGQFVALDQILFGRNMLDVAFASLVTVSVHKAVMRPSRPANDRIVGAICVYLLIGYAWASIYSTIHTAVPGSFRVPDDVAFDGSNQSFLYFSFVTLSTLGYGDITPVTRLAGTAAWMEAITGQLYIAITIASLLSAAIAERHRDQP